MDSKSVRHGLRVTIKNAAEADRGVWHVLDKAPHGKGQKQEWYLHRWETVSSPENPTKADDGGTASEEWRSVRASVSELQEASAVEADQDSMDYPQFEKAA